MATVTLTLTQTGPRPAAEYELEGHLDAGAAVYERNRPAARLAALVRLFGPA